MGTDGNPLDQSYSPRLFGSPHQFSNLCDMRLKSSDGDGPGQVGDYYLNLIKDAVKVYFVVGRAYFSGGKARLLDCWSMAHNYATVYSNYKQSANSYGNKAEIKVGDMPDEESTEEQEAALNNITLDEEDDTETEGGSIYGPNIDSLSTALSGIGGITAWAKAMSAEQPIYSFTSDWATYISRVKMMINSAVIMLGLNDSVVLEDKRYTPLINGLNAGSTNIWANYHWVGTTSAIGESVVSDGTENENYVAFMTDSDLKPTDGWTNSFGASQVLSAALESGKSVGTELAFLTSTSNTGVDDTILKFAEGATDAVNTIISNLGGSIGRFTAALGAGMAKTYMGNHYMYPQVFNSHSRDGGQSVQFSVKLATSDSSTYSYLFDILVPIFFALGMMLPGMANNSAAAYTYPPLVQCNIPGMWSCRMGYISSMTVSRDDFSAKGYPTHVTLSMTVVDLLPYLTASGMDVSDLTETLSNNPMYDFVAQYCGVDRYRPNGSIRILTKLAIASALMKKENIIAQIGSAITSDINDIINTKLGVARNW